MVVRPQLAHRQYSKHTAFTLEQQGVHPLMAQLVASRGVTSIDALKTDLASLSHPQTLKDAEQASRLLADAISQNKRLLIVADYDCDGATACAVGYRALSQMGACVDYLVPNRFETGYGLSPAVVDLACDHPSGQPDIIITVDNGIASIEGVAYAQTKNIDVIVTDHHLPSDELPNALAIVNPNQIDCPFPSKNLAGVGVIFYLMLNLRAELRRRGVYPPNGGPRLDSLLDLVALGTVADVVKLDSNNRVLVSQGLHRIQQGRMHAGVAALFQIATRDHRTASCFDLGFTIGPRINAAGRLSDMSIGIRCLCTDDLDEANELAKQLDSINRERKEIESKMREQAFDETQSIPVSSKASLCIYQPDWHQGVIGLVASKLKDRFWRPTIAFAKGDEGELKGSGRSIPDVHLRDVLDLVSKKHPHIITKFGGHAMAAGLSIKEEFYSVFVDALDESVIRLTGKQQFDPLIETDGSLSMTYLNLTTVEILEKQVWGAGFPAPVFQDKFTVLHQRLLGGKHLKLRLERDGNTFDAIWFNHDTLLPDSIEAAYRLDRNLWQGQVSLQILIEYAHEALDAELTRSTIDTSIH